MPVSPSPLPPRCREKVERLQKHTDDARYGRDDELQRQRADWEVPQPLLFIPHPSIHPKLCIVPQPLSFISHPSIHPKPQTVHSKLLTLNLKIISPRTT